LKKKKKQELSKFFMRTSENKLLTHPLTQNSHESEIKQEFLGQLAPPKSPIVQNTHPSYS
jgi:hypothetical protein